MNLRRHGKARRTGRCWPYLAIGSETSAHSFRCGLAAGLGVSNRRCRRGTTPAVGQKTLRTKRMGKGLARSERTGGSVRGLRLLRRDGVVSAGTMERGARGILDWGQENAARREISGGTRGRGIQIGHVRCGKAGLAPIPTAKSG